MELTPELLGAGAVGVIIILGAIGNYLHGLRTAHKTDALTAGVAGGFVDMNQMHELIGQVKRCADALDRLADTRQAAMQETLEEIVEEMRRPKPRRWVPTPFLDSPLGSDRAGILHLGGWRFPRARLFRSDVRSRHSRQGPADTPRHPCLLPLRPQRAARCRRAGQAARAGTFVPRGRSAAAPLLHRLPRGRARRSPDQHDDLAVACDGVRVLSTDGDFCGCGTDGDQAPPIFPRFPLHVPAPFCI